MATKELTFSKKTLDAAEHLGGQATRYRDPRYPNLYLEVGARSKTWRFRKFWKGANFTETLGTWPEMSVVEASQKAAKHSDGIEEKGVVIKPSGAFTIRLRLRRDEEHVIGVDRHRSLLERLPGAYAARPPFAAASRSGRRSRMGVCLLNMR